MDRQYVITVKTVTADKYEILIEDMYVTTVTTLKEADNVAHGVFAGLVAAGKIGIEISKVYM